MHALVLYYMVLKLILMFLLFLKIVVYISMIWANSKLNINNWYLKYDHEEFADIRKICSYLGNTLSLNLPEIQALTEWNTTSYF